MQVHAQTLMQAFDGKCRRSNGGKVGVLFLCLYIHYSHTHSLSLSLSPPHSQVIIFRMGPPIFLFTRNSKSDEVNTNRKSVDCQVVSLSGSLVPSFSFTTPGYFVMLLYKTHHLKTILLSMKHSSSHESGAEEHFRYVLRSGSIYLSCPGRKSNENPEDLFELVFVFWEEGITLLLCLLSFPFWFLVRSILCQMTIRCRSRSCHQKAREMILLLLCNFSITLLHSLLLWVN